MTQTHNPDRQIPVTILTGFLGSGKTTLLNHLLQSPEMANAAVLINEFGSVAVDHHLVAKLDEDVILLDSGCICCTVRGDLTRSLTDLFMRCMRREIKPINRVVIETTGLADPAPVIYTLMDDFFIGERYRIDGVVTVVDATHAEGQLAQLNTSFGHLAGPGAIPATAPLPSEQRVSDKLALPRIAIPAAKHAYSDHRELIDLCNTYEPVQDPPGGVT